MAFIAAGLFGVVLGFYLYGRGNRTASVFGSLLALVGLIITLYGLVTFLVPSFF